VYVIGTTVLGPSLVWIGDVVGCLLGYDTIDLFVFFPTWEGIGAAFVAGLCAEWLSQSQGRAAQRALAILGIAGYLLAVVIAWVAYLWK